METEHSCDADLAAKVSAAQLDATTKIVFSSSSTAASSSSDIAALVAVHASDGCAGEHGAEVSCDARFTTVGAPSEFPKLSAIAASSSYITVPSSQPSDSCQGEQQSGAPYQAPDASIEASQAPIADFESQYELLREVLGTGASGSVMRAICKKTSRRVAVKTYNKQKMSSKDLDFLRSEVNIHSESTHTNIVSLLEVHETEDTTFLVMEELQGGEVWDRLHEQRRFRETEAADLALQVFRALAFLHARGVAHRDIKPENLAYVQKGGRDLKLLDFGFAARVGSDGLRAKCGSLGFVAPEVLSGRGYDEQCDQWSMGSLLYHLLTGRPLLEGDEQEVLRKTRAYRKPDFRMEFWCLSEDAQHLLRSLLHADPRKRLTAPQALEHPWFLHVALNGGR
jgi:tRNA A-37 threonylcarbamoyl transferase component Bud32